MIVLAIWNDSLSAALYHLSTYWKHSIQSEHLFYAHAITFVDKPKAFDTARTKYYMIMPLYLSTKWKHSTQAEHILYDYTFTFVVKMKAFDTVRTYVLCFCHFICRHTEAFDAVKTLILFYAYAITFIDMLKAFDTIIWYIIFLCHLICRHTESIRYSQNIYSMIMKLHLSTYRKHSILWF